MIKVLLLAVFLLSVSQTQAMSLNDLSILIPLPQQSEMSLMLAPDSQGPEGALLSSNVFRKVIPLVPETPNHVVWKDSLKVIGIRIDPCFVEGTGPLACRRQIRLVWQPIVFIGARTETRDAALHSFYEFDDATFLKLWKDWQKLSSGSRRDALQVHPKMKAEGLRGPYWTYLRSLVLQYCGEKNLIRMTAMNVMNGEQMWVFQGLDVVNGEAVQVKIPRIEKWTQGVVQSSSHSQTFSGGMMPAPTKHDPDFVSLTADSLTAKNEFSEEQIRGVMKSALAYSNPEMHNPGTVDCASCHLSNMVLQWGEANYRFNWQKDFQDVTYQSPWNLANPTKTTVKTNQLRAFGYFLNMPAVSQRVINETANTATMLQLKR